ncbi:uncharacterized protein LOC117283538 [Fukomys damarensis]|uniref:uncharacterized protein LOC117283538 n=1 Tax=Fukomys damarensis TaxID=885580 RepID=UPI0014552A1B|nr:uncharacterized protein LOC117283538 [Fukomys damarensis]
MIPCNLKFAPVEGALATEKPPGCDSRAEQSVSLTKSGVICNGCFTLTDLEDTLPHLYCRDTVVAQMAAVGGGQPSRSWRPGLEARAAAPPADRGEAKPRLSARDWGSLQPPPPPLSPCPGPLGPIRDWIPGDASYPTPAGRAGTMLGITRFTRGSEAAGTHQTLQGTWAQSLLGCRRWFGRGVAYGQDRGFCGQRGALGSLSASSIFQLGDLGQVFGLIRVYDSVSF